MKTRVIVLCILMASLLLVSCFNEKDRPENGELSHPDMVLSDADFSNGEVTLRCSLMSVYDNGQRYHLENVSFERGTLSGNSDEAVITGETSVVFHGNVRLYESDQNITISAGDLVYDSQSGLLEASGPVTVVYSDGLEITSGDFHADIGNGIYEFNSVGEGHFSDKS